MRTRRKEIVIEVVLFNVSAPFNPVLPLIWKKKGIWGKREMGKTQRQIQEFGKVQCKSE